MDDEADEELRANARSGKRKASFAERNEDVNATDLSGDEKGDDEERKLPMSKKERKASKKEEYKERVAREEAEQEAARQREMAQPEYPIVEFCLGMGEMPWEGASTKWGYTNRDMNVAVPSPSNKLERVNDVPLAKGYTWADVASAVEDAALDEGSGGNICNVTGAKLSADRLTLEVEFDISAAF
jgi:hypothetical protein